MIMISTSLIDLENVQVSHSKDMFLPSQLNAMAETISELGGVLNPLIVIRTGVETVQIIDGHLSYWAQVQAYEKTQNPDISMIRVFILTKDQLNTALKQRSIDQNNYL
jgi:ParB family chromosome partitioning protein